ncbi:nucleolin-like [Salvia splendens]|uniref:nucleolin-like n=1 Tax=Salvia splendens TaxID=180675 RepID=UPI001C27F06A|nr:nucleolin-like [Salvia splendens]XP_042012099.1 nucleolin-like [Salvia splendens]
MTTEEFQSILDGVRRVEEDAAKMAEGPDLASEAVDNKIREEPMRESQEEPAKPVEKAESEKVMESEKEKTKVPTDQHKTKVSTAKKSKAVKRKLVLKDYPKAERQKPKRISQGCLGRGMAEKAGANTASEAVEILSEEERMTPTKPWEDPKSATAQEESHPEIEPKSSTPTGQEEGTPTKPRENLSEVPPEPVEEKIVEALITQPTSQDEPSTSADVKREEEDEEKRYQLERKRKGKAPVQKKQSNKKACTVITGIMIRYSKQRSLPPRREDSDEEYASGDEPESEDDVSLEDENFQEYQLPENHHELIHPPVERMEYLPWQVELDD